MIIELQNTWSVSDKLKRETDKTVIVVGDFDNHLSENKDKKKISYYIEDLKTSRPIWTVIYSIIFPQTAEYTFFSNTQGLVTKIDHNAGTWNIQKDWNYTQWVL